MSMSNKYDIIFLGAGPGGYIAALKAAQMGASVAIVEQGYLGGTCLNVGCIPSKALLASAELIHSIRGAASMGVKVSGDVTFDWPAIQARKDKVLQTLRGGIKSLFASRKVTLIQGRGKLNGPGKVTVETKAGTEEISASKIIIAVGSIPARIPGWPTDPERVCTSDESLHWKTLPARLLIVGGGVIGCEFACMMREFGVQVSVVELMPRLLPELDESLGEPLQKVFTKRGIQCFTGTKVETLTVGDTVKAVLSNGQTVEADRVLLSIGRRANTADIGLETVGLTTDRGFIRVDDHMETPVKGIYCIGDANGRCLLAHAASAQGVAAVENALGHSHAFTAPIPSAVYTFPEIGAVGITQAQAKKAGIPIAIGVFPLAALGKAIAVGHSEGFVKVIRHRETGLLLGVHMMGHNATECIASAGAMLHKKVTVQELAEVVYAHPTIGESIKEAAEDALGMALHLPPRKVLRATAG
ncbi:MAG: dihydrolipoyl dehydrogenase [bacterium]